MTHQQHPLQVETRGRGMTELSAELRDLQRASGITTGLAVVFCQHTSCSLVIQENADPSASRDLLAWLDRLAPEHDPAYTHTAEGPDDMPAHLRAVLTSSSESIPIVDGELALGTWQGLFLLEHRRAPHTRRLIVHLSGE
ncbi:MAG: hypothetical protein DHS20C15_10430 [Planctomycetota bacterium]|nr:MAG: hypothetical protein DHS20C15_10430 [Planctomycetota bacterium]